MHLPRMKASTDLRYAISLLARGRTGRDSPITVRNRVQWLSGVLGEYRRYVQTEPRIYMPVARSERGQGVLEFLLGRWLA